MHGMNACTGRSSYFCMVVHQPGSCAMRSATACLCSIAFALAVTAKDMYDIDPPAHCNPPHTKPNDDDPRTCQWDCHWSTRPEPAKSECVCKDGMHRIPNYDDHRVKCHKGHVGEDGRCANWFGGMVNWTKLAPIAERHEENGPWGIMNGNACTREVLGEEDNYHCAVLQSDGHFHVCEGTDCVDGKCIDMPSPHAEL